MPLADAGRALFAGSAAEFMDMAPASRLTAHLVGAFEAREAEPAGASEVKSWRESLTALAAVTRDARLAEYGVGVELKVPEYDRRIDATFVARDRGGAPHAVVVELKQWADAASSPIAEYVRLGPGQRARHPSAQAAEYADDLRGTHSAFTEMGYRLSACAYLHNMPLHRSHAIRGAAYAGPLADAPLFCRDERDAFAGFLDERLRGGGGMSLLPALVQGTFSPSERLVDALGRSLKGSPVFRLRSEQVHAFNIVRAHVEHAPPGEKLVLIVTGGPGTGKSVIAANLLATLLKAEKGERRRKVAHASGARAFTINLRAVGGRGTQSLFRVFMSFAHKRTAADGLDVLICDEAHRIRPTSNTFRTPAAMRSEMPQVDELVRAATVSVFLLDERQNVRPDEVGSVALVEAAAARAGARVERVALDAQFRCSGSRGYIRWADALFTDVPQPAGAWRTAPGRTGEYRLTVFDDPEALDRAVRARAGDGTRARLLAGFCWPWSDPRPDGTLVPDVEIGDWLRPWNEKPQDQTKGGKGAPSPANNPVYQWAMLPKGLDEVGCVYTAQGLEWDYCGVILGDDLVWRDGVGWVSSARGSCDPAFRGLDDVDALIKQAYRVLLTRGRKGTFLYSTDYDTRRKLRELIAAAG